MAHGVNYLEKVEIYTKLGSCFLVRNTQNQEDSSEKGH
jgi:hypothetical protein